MNKYFGLVAILLVVVLGSVCIQATCGPDMESTIKIVQTLCQEGNHEEEVAKLFFACYDNVVGRVLFVRCQLRIFGAPLDSKQNIANTCAQGGQLPNYAVCLQQEFESAQIDLTEEVTKVNRCQGELLGTC